MEQGNNIECLKTFRLKIPLYNIDSAGKPGVKYFFPEAPILLNKTIVGIDANLRDTGLGFENGDIITPLDILNPAYENALNILAAENVYCTIFSDTGEEKFYNVPLRSFFMVPSSTPPSTLKQPRRVKPYYGKINPRKSYLFLPVNFTTLFGLRFYVYLTFYYN